MVVTTRDHHFPLGFWRWSALRVQYIQYRACQDIKKGSTARMIQAFEVRGTCGRGGLQQEMVTRTGICTFNVHIIYINYCVIMIMKFNDNDINKSNNNNHHHHQPFASMFFLHGAGGAQQEGSWPWTCCHALGRCRSGHPAHVPGRCRKMMVRTIRITPW